RLSFDSTQLSQNWLRVWYSFGRRSTGENAGLVVSLQISLVSFSTSLTRSLPMSRAISVLQAKSAWKLAAVSVLISMLRCQAPLNGSRISGYQPPLPAGTEASALAFSPVNGIGQPRIFIGASPARSRAAAAPR